MLETYCKFTLLMVASRYKKIILALVGGLFLDCYFMWLCFLYTFLIKYIVSHSQKKHNRLEGFFMSDTGFVIKSGRSKTNQFMIAEFQLLDLINEYGSIELLGFYLTLKRYINRVTNTKDNQITFSSKTIMKKMGIGNSKYYRLLKMAYNAGLLDQERYITFEYFVNYNKEDTKNPFLKSTYLTFSSLDCIDIELKNKGKAFISASEGYPEELIYIQKSSILTTYIIHEMPPSEVFDKHGKLFAFRDYDTDLERFKKTKKQTNTPQSQNAITLQSQNAIVPDSQNTNTPQSQNAMTKNNIIKLSSLIFSSIKSYQSIYQPPYPASLFDDKKFIDGLIEQQIEIDFIQIIDKIRLVDFDLSKVQSILDIILDLYTTSSLSVSGNEYNNASLKALLKRMNYQVIFKSLLKFEDEISDVHKQIKNPKAYLRSMIINTALDNQTLEVIDWK